MVSEWISRWTAKKCASGDSEENNATLSPTVTESELRGNSLANFQVDDSGAVPGPEPAIPGPVPVLQNATIRTEASGIIATAIPQITDEFGSISHIGWYGSAYLMTMSAFQLVFGRLYGNFEAKSVFLISLLLFELGSVLCAACPSSEMLILGRAIAGVGAAGVCSGVFSLFALALPARKLPTYTGAIGTVYGLSAVLGPIIGGVITNSSLTWRWCFYINLPLSIPPVVAVVFFIHTPPTQESGESWLSKLKKLDYLGIILLIPGISSFVVALEFGSSSHGWGAGSTIGLFVASGVIQEASPSEAGVRHLALCVPFAIAILGSGWLVSKFGYVQPFMLIGTVLVSMAGGLLSTLKPDSGAVLWITFQIIAGIGIGTSTEQPAIAVQALVEESDAPLGIAAVLFCQNLGPTVALSIANSIFMTGMTRDIPSVFPGLDAKAIVASGATELRNLVPVEDVPVLVEIYNQSLTRVFVLAAAFAAGSVIGILGSGWKRITRDEPEQE
ncbi:major facilitator superfamily transporter [Rhypophila sp. PSN 637]